MMVAERPVRLRTPGCSWARSLPWRRWN